MNKFDSQPWALPEGIDMEEYAKDHEELAMSLVLWGKKTEIKGS